MAPSRLLPILLLLTGCAATADTLPSKKALRLLRASYGAWPVGWRLAGSWDPYLPAVTHLPDPAYPQCLSLFRDGRFTEDNGMQFSAGDWSMDTSGTYLQFRYRLQYDTPIPAHAAGEVQAAKWFRPAPDTLVLAKQGRHGWVRYYFVPEP